MKKVFPFEPNKTVLIELAFYGIALTLAVFTTASFFENLGLLNAYITIIVSLGVLVGVAFYLMPAFKPEFYQEVTADSIEGYIQKGKVKIDRNDTKSIYIINYKEGKQTWQIFRVNGKRSIGVDTRSYPEADKLNAMLAKIFPNIKIKRVNAKSPFMTIIFSSLIYIAILWLVGALI
ncbi:MAG: hypothetical protein KA140_07725 [Caldisericia bacterium]|nr:hypothetical protein [Caldisericia bacterium]